MQPPQPTSTGRVLWIIWCCICAFWWFISGFTIFFFIGWLGVPLSLAAILLPVGKGPNQPRRPAYHVVKHHPDGTTEGYVVNGYDQWKKEMGGQ